MGRFGLRFLATLIIGHTLFAQLPQWRLANGTQGIRISDIDIYLGNPDTLYAFGEQFLSSSDRGENWQIIPFNDAFNGAIKVDRFDSQTLYLNKDLSYTYGNVVMMSTDGGASWNMLLDGMGLSPAFLEINPVNLRTVYANVNPNELYRSPTPCCSWKMVPLPNLYNTTALTIVPSDTNTLYLSSIDNIIKSSDGGLTWTFITPPVSFSSVADLAAHPDSANVVYAALYGAGVYKSIDGGITWVEKNNGLTSSDWNLHTIVINPKRPQEIYIGIGSDQTNLIFRTTDAGENWYAFSDGIPFPGFVGSIAIDTLRNRIYSAVFAPPAEGIYVYDSLTLINYDEFEVPQKFILHQNYPNPFNSTTTIGYVLPQTAQVRLDVYDARSKRVAQLVKQVQPAGSYSVTLSGSTLSSGIYFYRLELSNLKKEKTKILTRKALLIK